MSRSLRSTFCAISRIQRRHFHLTTRALEEEEPGARRTAEQLGFSPVKRERILEPLNIPNTSSDNINYLTQKAEKAVADNGSRSPRRPQAAASYQNRIRNGRSPLYGGASASSESGVPADGARQRRDREGTRENGNGGRNQFRSREDREQGNGDRNQFRSRDRTPRNADSARMGRPNRPRDGASASPDGVSPPSNQAEFNGSTNTPQTPGSDFVRSLPLGDVRLPSSLARQRNLSKIEGLDGSLDVAEVVQPVVGAGGRKRNNNNDNKNNNNRDRNNNSKSRRSDGPARATTVAGAARYQPAGMKTERGTGKPTKNMEPVADHSPAGLFGKRSLLFATAKPARAAESSFWAAGMSSAEARKADVRRVAGDTSLYLPSIPFPVNSRLSPNERAKNAAIWSLALNKSVAMRQRVPAEEVIKGYLS